jgi:hypothetical protein
MVWLWAFGGAWQRQCSGCITGTLKLRVKVPLIAGQGLLRIAFQNPPEYSAIEELEGLIWIVGQPWKFNLKNEMEEGAIGSLNISTSKDVTSLVFIS